VRAINVRRKGQITLPADIRDELGVNDGGKLLLERRGNEWVLIQPNVLKDRTAGALAEYARNMPTMTPSEMQEASTAAIAEENLATLREIDQDYESH